MQTITRRERPKSAPYLRLKNTKIFKEQLLKTFGKFFFRKKVFFKKSCTMKNSKRGHLGSLNVFTNRKLQKDARGPFDRIRKFSKKSRIVPKKQPKGVFGLASTFGSKKKLWFSARIETAISCFSEINLFLSFASSSRHFTYRFA